MESLTHANYINKPSSFSGIHYNSETGDQSNVEAVDSQPPLQELDSNWQIIMCHSSILFLYLNNCMLPLPTKVSMVASHGLGLGVLAFTKKKGSRSWETECTHHYYIQPRDAWVHEALNVVVIAFPHSSSITLWLISRHVGNDMFIDSRCIILLIVLILRGYTFQ